MKFLIILMACACIACSKNKDSETPAELVKDTDGNRYDVVSIGSQTWMKQNLKTAHYRNGEAIPQETDPAAWSALTSGAWCWYNNDSATYASTYGKLYNWYAVNDPRGLAPEGWHIPDDVEWTSLVNAQGGNATAGGALKEAGYQYWNTPNSDATNKSRFSGLAGGFRSADGDFHNIHFSGYWWTATASSNLLSWQYELLYNESGVRKNPLHKTNGFSIRCIRN